MKSIKEMLLETLKNGPEVLTDITACRRNGKDIITEIGRVDKKIAEYHPKMLNLEVSEIIPNGNEAKTFRLTSENGYLPPFLAGQFINLFVETDGVRTSRPYSLSSSPLQRGYYEITVARTADGFVSAYLLDKVKPGDRFEANGPAGHFYINPVFHKKKSVFIAGGSGITPFVSMIRDILESGKNRDIILLYGCRKENAALFYEELKEKALAHPNFRFELIVSEDESFKGRKGLIDAEIIRETVQTTDVHREVFGASKSIQTEPGWPSDLTGNEVFKIKTDGKIIPAKSGESVLAALERAGIKAPVCCRSGGCGICRVRLVSGKVFTARGVLKRYADEMFGYIHSCKCFPISDLEILL